MRAGVSNKQLVALSSVVAAIGLTGMKIVVGLATNSLGILSEAAHSGLDLIAALVTLFAVRLSDKPADDEHLYGHGKIENLSALFETLLLLGTCAWIVREAVERLFAKSVEVQPTFWAFAVLVVSIVVDWSRSRALARAAREHQSQALEADALHFSTDIWSSLVVVAGLLGVLAADRFPQYSTWLNKADAVAALGVAIIVIVISLRLGRQTLQGLLDTAPAGLSAQIKPAVEAIEGVADCHRIRVRSAGPLLFVDVHVLIDGSTTLRDAHVLTDLIEQRIQQIAPNADVTVHPEPTEQG